MPRLLRPPHELGIVVWNNGGFRVHLAAMLELGASSATRGPNRTTKAAANKDLAKARKCASRKEMLEFVRALHKACASTASGGARPIGKRKCQRKLTDAKADHAASARSSEEAHPPLASPGKRLRTKSHAPAAPGLSPTAASIGGSSSSAGANKQLAWKSQPHKCAGRAAEAIIAETESFPRMKNPEQGPRYPSCALDASAAGFVLNWGNPTELTVRHPARGAVPRHEQLVALALSELARALLIVEEVVLIAVASRLRCDREQATKKWNKWVLVPAY